MAMKCKVCNHPERIEIDRRLARNGNVAQLAREYGLSRHTLDRHKFKHLSRQLKTAIDIKERSHSFSIWDEVLLMFDEIEEIVQKAKRKGRILDSVAAFREKRAMLEFMFKAQYTKYREDERKEQEAKEQEEPDYQRLSVPELRLLKFLAEKAQGLHDGSIESMEDMWDVGYSSCSAQG